MGDDLKLFGLSDIDGFAKDNQMSTILKVRFRKAMMKLTEQQELYQHLNYQMSNINQPMNNFDVGGGLKEKVLAIISHPQHENKEFGCNDEAVFSSLSNENVQEIRAAIEELCDNGYVYTTIDEKHYKCSTNRRYFLT